MIIAIGLIFICLVFILSMKLESNSYKKKLQDKKKISSNNDITITCTRTDGGKKEKDDDITGNSIAKLLAKKYFIFDFFTDSSICYIKTQNKNYKIKKIEWNDDKKRIIVSGDNFSIEIQKEKSKSLKKDVKN